MGVAFCIARARSLTPIISKRRNRASGSAPDCGPTMPRVASGVARGACRGNTVFTDMRVATGAHISIAYYRTI